MSIWLRFRSGIIYGDELILLHITILVGFFHRSSQNVILCRNIGLLWKLFYIRGRDETLVVRASSVSLDYSVQGRTKFPKAFFTCNKIGLWVLNGITFGCI